MAPTRRRRAAVGVLLLPLLLLTFAQCTAVVEEAEPVAPVLSGAVPIAAAVRSEPFGVRLEVQVRFGEDRVVTGARLHWAGGSADVVRRLPGPDAEPADGDLDLQAGTPMLLAGTVLAPCPDLPTPVVFEVDSTEGGTRRTDRFVAEETEALTSAFERWCRQPASVRFARSEVTRDGDYTVVLDVVNPGPVAAIVTFAGTSIADTTWEPAFLVVEAGTRRVLRLRGHGPPGCLAVPPAGGGRLRIDDRTVQLPDWC
ncbi:hypothetical protein KG112_05365 [Nocardioides sp. zg-ZUI104]|uniref:hypothetical protein n=1 Tax=Nocardioides faecalis TaxID=2803858 RepID=UPI001BCBD3B2|nr:hypothetical protein [Nocardioides faecalis]MBS4752236.1 hypothetical protein [Nocardioides faecalis]